MQSNIFGRISATITSVAPLFTNPLVISNEYFSNYLDTSDEWIMKEQVFPKAFCFGGRY